MNSKKNMHTIKKQIILFSLLLFFVLTKAQVPASDMIALTAGSFTMGNSTFTRESPARSVNVSAFYISKNTVTNAQFAQFVNQYGSVTVRNGEFVDKPLFKEDSWGIVNINGTWTAATGFELYPMIKVTWYGAVEFCKWNGGRLPNEAEWEYAAKGGASSQAYTFSGSNTATTVAWYADNSGHTNKAVGTRTANSLGLYDMSGNVYQWCSDWFGRYGDFGTSGELNPQGPQSGVSKVIRGGYRSIGSGDLHLTNRESVSPDETYNFVGFRLVKDSLSTGLSRVNDNIRVYPNPASDKLILSAVDPNAKVEIIDSKGRILYKATVQNTNILLKGYTSGLYIVKITDSNTEIFKKIIVKN